MKSFITKILILGSATILIVFAIKSMLPQRKNYHSAFVDKLQLLQSLKNEKKIVLIGGSSVGLGISAEQIEKATRIKTVNVGHHAGFGLIDFQPFIMSCINSDDIIIFSPEWRFYDHLYFHDTATLEDLYSNLPYLELTDKPLSLKIKSIFLKKINLFKQPAFSAFRYDCLNQNGDIISHCGLPQEQLATYSVSFRSFSVDSFKRAFPFTERPNTFILFPPTQQKIYENNPNAFRYIEKIMFQSGLKILDSVQSQVFPEKDFFDAHYHLNCETRQKRTEKILTALQKFR